MNWKRQTLLCVLAVWLLFSYTIAVYWAMPRGERYIPLWGWFDRETVEREFDIFPPGQSSAQRLVTLAIPGLIVGIALWFVLGDIKK